MKIVVITIAIIFVAGIGFSLNVSAEENFIPFWIKSSAKFWVDGQISDAEFMKTLEYLINTKIINISDKSYSEEYEKMEKRVESLEKQNQQLLDRLYQMGDTYSGTTSNSEQIQTKYFEANSELNIKGLNTYITKFGFMDAKPDEFSLDMSLEYTRSGSDVEFEVTQVRFTTDDHFSYEADKSQFIKFNGIYKPSSIYRGIVQVEDVPKGLEGDLQILIFVREVENNYYIQDYIFTYEFNLDGEVAKLNCVGC